MAISSAQEKSPVAASSDAKTQSLLSASDQRRSVPATKLNADSNEDKGGNSGNYHSISNGIDGGFGGWSSSSISDDVVKAPLNDLGGNGSSHHTRNSNSYSSSTNSNSFQSSLSSFLSVLLEDEEIDTPYSISIVPDNPKPEQRSIRELRTSFIKTALENDKPKCRWDYLTRDNSDRDLMSRSRRRSKLTIRPSSFSGAFPTSSGNGSGKHRRQQLPSRSSSMGGRKTAADIFLQMPKRQKSPTDEATQKKSLMDRFNMSDTDLLLLPIPVQGGHSKERDLHNSFGGQQRRMSRSGDRDTGNGNATWSNEDVQERRKTKANCFLDILMEPDGEPAAKSAGSGFPSRSLPSMEASFSNGFKASRRKKIQQQLSSSRPPSKPSRDFRSRRKHNTPPPSLAKPFVDKEKSASTTPPQIPTRHTELSPVQKSPRSSRRIRSPPPDNRESPR
mmetsp:Transcript_12589/g.26655  ORF Transcript_12589/g.26655 Transcript_12589/m.26655 type:complete len:447 (-) Transcript_12589:243-1583(-)